MKFRRDLREPIRTLDNRLPRISGCSLSCDELLIGVTRGNLVPASLVNRFKPRFACSLYFLRSLSLSTCILCPT